MLRPLVVAVFAMLGVLGAATPAAQERARLLELQRTAVDHLRQAARTGAPVDEIRRALSEASRSLDALGAEPVRSGAAESTPSPLLPAALRADLRRAAAELTALAAGDTQRVATATAPILALLEKVRAQLEGEVALGLTFEGSYSQTKPKEPTYGGHASAMGPAPASIASPEDAAPVLVTFEEGARLPSKMFCGGAAKDHILESA